MALAATTRSIGAVTQLLIQQLAKDVIPDVVAGHPEEVISANPNDERIGLFLYEMDHDPSLKNVSLVGGEPPPLWLMLKYLLIAVDKAGATDSVGAHRLLARAMACLHQNPYLPLNLLSAADRAALEPNPEPLKVTFENANTDLLNKINYGGASSNRYRIMAAIQVRPVLIAPGLPEAWPLLVGMDYTQTPPVPRAQEGRDGFRLSALSTMGPRVNSLTPLIVEPDAEIKVSGAELTGSGLSAMISGVPLNLLSQQPEELKFKLATAVVFAAGGVSACAG
jgi:hypothetical protein